MRGSQFTKKGREHENDLAMRIRSDGGSALRATGGCTTDGRRRAPGARKLSSLPAGSRSPSLPDVGAEAAARASADADLSARISALSETDIVGRWSVTGSTDCLQSTNGFSAQTYSPSIPLAGSGSTTVSRLGGTFMGTRTFYAGGTGRSVGTTHSMTFPALSVIRPVRTRLQPPRVSPAPRAWRRWMLPSPGRSAATARCSSTTTTRSRSRSPRRLRCSGRRRRSVRAVVCGLHRQGQADHRADAQRHGDRDQRSEGCERKPAQPHAALLRALARAIAAAELDTVGFSQRESGCAFTAAPASSPMPCTIRRAAIGQSELM